MAAAFQTYGVLPDGEKVTLHTLSNRRGMRAELIDYGATLVRLFVPDARGELADVVLGFDALEGYLHPKNPYFGTTIGRCANRIANGAFSIDGAAYQLPLNGGPHAVHGGRKGFDKFVWKAEAMPGKNAVRFTRTSPDGEEGYPGAVEAAVTYTLTEENELCIDLDATTDRPTLLNMTHHSYFNLAGEGRGTILEHRVTLAAEHYTPANAQLLPTGEIRAVGGTPFDFRAPHAIGERLAEVGGQPVGYDHNYILSGAGLRHAAAVVDPASGRRLKMAASEPGFQFYTGNFLDGAVVGKNGHAYPQYAGFCLEPQKFPDSPRHPHFPSPIVRPGQAYHSEIVYAFD